MEAARRSSCWLRARTRMLVEAATLWPSGAASHGGSQRHPGRAPLPGARGRRALGLCVGAGVKGSMTMESAARAWRADVAGTCAGQLTGLHAPPDRGRRGLVSSAA